MKILIFLAAFCFVVPVGTILACKDERWRTLFFCLAVFFTCNAVLIHIAPLPDWRGASRGFAFSMVDFSTMILLSSMIFDKKYKITLFPPGVWFYFIYWALSCVSVYQTKYLQPWGFEFLKMFWMYIYLVAMYNYLNHIRNFWPWIYTVVFIMLFMLIVGFNQKYIQGRYQVAATMPHQNSLALYTIEYGAILLGIFLNEKQNKIQRWIVLFGLGCIGLLMLFTLSRGGLAGFAFAIALVVAGSLVVNGFALKRVAIVAVLTVLMMIPLSIAAPRIVQRFLYAPESSKQTRINLANAATRIADSHFWGVGLNNFSAFSGPFAGYNDEHYEGMKLSEDDEFGGIVETIYLLVAAECGWITMWSLVAWFLYYLLLDIKNLFRYRKLPCFGIAVGIMAGLSSNYAQSTIEWSLRQYNNFYQLMMLYAVIGVMHTVYKERKAREKAGYAVFQAK